MSLAGKWQQSQSEQSKVLGMAQIAMLVAATRCIVPHGGNKGAVGFAQAKAIPRLFEQ